MLLKKSDVKYEIVIPCIRFFVEKNENYDVDEFLKVRKEQGDSMVNSSRNASEPYITSKSKSYFAFNIWSIETAKAVIDGASKTGQDVILQTSMKAFQKLDKEELRSFISSYMDKKKVKAYLHLDHCKDPEQIEEAIRYGWDSVMIDASDKALKENIERTNTVWETAQKHHVLVEAEIGQIFKTGDDRHSVEAGIAAIEDIKTFVKRSKVDILAAAVGTAHGLYKGMPKIHYDLIENIIAFTNIPLAIHGGTGLTDEMLLKLLSYENIKKINISTEVKLAYRKGITESVRKGYTDGNAFDPLRVEGLIHDSLEDMAANKLKLLRKE